MKLTHDNRPQTKNVLRDTFSEIDGELAKVSTDYVEVSEVRKLMQTIFDKRLS